MTRKSIKNKLKMLVILGPTATGKSELAVKLAKKFNGEIISADSRQVYKGLGIGTGKITKREMRGIPHYMLDVISPKKTFSAHDFQKQAKKIITDILSRNKLPIICGGTGYYVRYIVHNIVLPAVPPDIKLRKKLEKKSLPELQVLLKKLDQRRAENIDMKNPVRLIRAIEIATQLGSVPEVKEIKSPYNILEIGLKLDDKELKAKIHNRVLSRLKKGMIKEAQNLHKNGLTLKRMRGFGMEYGYLADYIKNKISKKELAYNIEKGNLDYAKRQITWFKKDKRIKWFNPNQTKKVFLEVKKFVD
jgi:tRNA dimethylallyltransferase